MRRYSPFIISGVGVVLIVLSVAGILPGLAGAGGGLLFFGLLLFGLNFIPKPESVSDQPPMNSIEQLAAIFYSPADVFKNLRRHPRWLAPLLVMSILASVYLITFTQRLTPERLASFVSEKTEQTTEQMGVSMPAEQKAKMREDNLKQFTNPLTQVGNGVAGFVGAFVAFAIVAGIYLIIVLAMGGQINFWQAFAATVFSWFPVMVIHRVLSFVILFIKDPTDIHPIIGQQTLVTDNLGALLNPADSPALWVLASSIGLLSLYHLWLAASGLKNAGERVSGSTAWTAAIIVWVFGVAIGVLSAALFPGFIS
jgi:hypothetical protein